MKTGLHVGPTKKAIKAKTGSIVEVLSAINENHISDKVALKALDVLEHATKFENIIVQDCTFNG